MRRPRRTKINMGKPAGFPTITRTQIENIPKYLENPIAIIESKSTNARKNSIVAILDMSHNGKQ